MNGQSYVLMHDMHTNVCAIIVCVKMKSERELNNDGESYMCEFYLFHDTTKIYYELKIHLNQNQTGPNNIFRFLHLFHYLYYFRIIDHYWCHIRNALLCNIQYRFLFCVLH